MLYCYISDKTLVTVVNLLAVIPFACVFTSSFVPTTNVQRRSTLSLLTTPAAETMLAYCTSCEAMNSAVMCHTVDN